MKTKKWMGALALVLAVVLPVMGLASEDFGAAAVNQDGTYTVEQMLTYAIQDEYLAQAEYKAIIAKFGVDRPFTNIMKAEGVHVQHLLPLFAAYSIAVPADTAAEYVVLPETLEEIYQIGVTAEVHNIGMYETFLKQEGLPEDVKGVFELLKRASENHLQAFQRNTDKPGDGQGSRGGNRWADDDNARTYGNRNRPGNTADGEAQPRNGRGRWGN
ncbi:MAG: DUF2202 domain-containing protein [Eubacteriales bacterium]|nr:DUF2202 domain-containing protein [Eubacteriales bacterium]